MYAGIDKSSLLNPLATLRTLIPAKTNKPIASNTRMPGDTFNKIIFLFNLLILNQQYPLTQEYQH